MKEHRRLAATAVVILGMVASALVWVSAAPADEEAAAGEAGVSANLQTEAVRANEGTTANFTVTLTAPSDEEVVVIYSTRTGTATAADFTEQTRQQLVFTPGDQTETISIAISDDERNERDETFLVQLNSATNATLGNAAARGHIIDTDVPDISIWNDSYPITEGGSVPFVLVSSVVTDFALPVLVTYSLSKGGMLQASTEIVEIPAGKQRFKFYKRTQDNLIDDADGTLAATISQPEGSDITISQFRSARAIIYDNDNSDSSDGIIGDGVFLHTINDTENYDTPTNIETNIRLTQGATSVGTVVSASNGDIPTYHETSGLEATTHSYDLPLATFHFNPTGHKIHIILKHDAINNLRTGADITYSMIRRKIDSSGNPVGVCGNLQPVNEDGRNCHDSDTLVRFIGTDEKPGLLLSTSNEIIKEGEPGDFILELTHAAEVDWLVDWSYHIEGDYGVSGISADAAGSHTFLPGQTRHRVTWTTEDDRKDEGEDGLVFLAVSGGYYIRTNTAPHNRKSLQTVTIKNDDKEEASLSPVTVTEGRLASVPITLGAEFDEPVTVYLTTRNGSAEANSDFDPRPAPNDRVTIHPGSRTGLFSIQTINDSEPESAEQFYVAIASVSAGQIGSPSEVPVTIIDDDTVASSPSISIAPASAVEGQPLEFIVQLTEPVDEAVTVNYYTRKGTADPDEFSGIAESSPLTLTFAPRQLRKTITINTSDDDVDEPNETIHIVLDNLSDNASYLSATALGTILDNEAPPVVTVSGGTITEGGKLVYTASISRPTYFDVSVNWETYDGTGVSGGAGEVYAGAGTDFTGNSGTIEWEAYSGSDITFAVDTTDDTDHETQEFLLVDLTGITNGAALAGFEATGFIQDNDEPPTLSVSADPISEGSPLSFEIALSHKTYLTITADYRTQDGTADSDDYTSTSGTASFAPGTLTADVSVATTDDSNHEDTETVQLELHAATGITLSESVIGEGQITDNDPAPTINISDATITEGGTLEFDVTLTGVSYQQITANYATSDGTATAGEDYTAKTGTVSFAPGETTDTIRIATIDEDDYEPTETLNVTLTGFTGGPIVGTTAQPLTEISAQGHITNNDIIPSVSIADATSEEGSNLSFEVSLSHKTYQRAAVGIRLIDGSAQLGEDYRFAATSLVFEPGETTKTLEVETIGDDDKEGSETLTAEIFIHSYSVTLNDGTATGTITDDDQMPAVSISDGSVTEGGEIEFIISLSHKSDGEVSGRYRTVDGQC